MISKLKGIEKHEGRILKDRICVVCGNKFDVKLGEGGKIPVQYFYSKHLGENIMGEGEEYWECETCSGYIKERMKEWMLKNWGERCMDHVEGCALCEAWRCFDYLFETDNNESDNRE